MLSMGTAEFPLGIKWAVKCHFFDLQYGFVELGHYDDEFLSCAWVDKTPLIPILSIGAQLNDLHYSLTVFYLDQQIGKSLQRFNVFPFVKGEIT